MNKASGGGRIPVELLQILKDDAVKVLHSVQFSSVVQSSPTLRPHEPQHARPPCPLPTPGVHPNPCPLSWACHLTISSSVILFSFCLQSFPTSGSFQMSQLFPLNMSAKKWPQNWKRSVFIPIPKKGNAKERSNYCTIALI